MSMKFESLLEITTVVVSLVAAMVFFGIVLTANMLPVPSGVANAHVSAIAKSERLSHPG